MPRKQNENLKKGKANQFKSGAEAAKNGKKGGIASGEAKRRKKDLRLALEMLLEKDITSKDGQKMSGTEAITAKLFEQALKGNIKAFETIRSTVGQDPVQKVEQVNIDMEYEESVEYLKELRKRRNGITEEEGD
jgi:hypothetical protein